MQRLLPKPHLIVDTKDRCFTKPGQLAHGLILYPFQLVKQGTAIHLSEAPRLTGRTRCILPGLRTTAMTSAARRVPITRILSLSPASWMLQAAGVQTTVASLPLCPASIPRPSLLLLLGHQHLTTYPFLELLLFSSLCHQPRTHSIAGHAAVFYAREEFFKLAIKSRIYAL